VTKATYSCDAHELVCYNGKLASISSHTLIIMVRLSFLNNFFITKRLVLLSLSLDLPLVLSHDPPFIVQGDTT
jgi:hypothetical protein